VRTLRARTTSRHFRREAIWMLLFPLAIVSIAIIVGLLLPRFL
jgi:hypothetical protein